MEKKELDTVSPTENRRIKTSFNLQKTQLEGLAKISEIQKVTVTAMLDEAIADFLAKKSNTQEIDQMLRQTNGFWFERSLETVKTLLPKQKIEKLLPYAKAYLYFNLKDNADRERVFEALALSEELKEINAVNVILGKASMYKGDELKSYNLHIVANELRANLTPLQQDYLSLKIGKDAFAKLKERRPEMFPEPKMFSEEVDLFPSEPEAETETE